MSSHFRSFRSEPLSLAQRTARYGEIFTEMLKDISIDVRSKFLNFLSHSCVYSPPAWADATKHLTTARFFCAFCAWVYVTCTCLFLTWWAHALPSGLSAEERCNSDIYYSPTRQNRISAIPIDCSITRSFKSLSGIVPFHGLILEAVVTFACALVRAAVHSRQQCIRGS